jgi:Phytanoyl-CoA dioxygenase (PhyH)
LIKQSDHITSGFDIVPAVLDRHEIAVVAGALQQEGLERSRAGARHLMRYPIVQQLARDPRLLTIAARFVGATSVPYRATLFDKSSARNWLVVWHQDTTLPLRERRDAPGWGPWSVKPGITCAQAPAAPLSRVIALRLHIDDSRADNGPLRVLPGTHTMGVCPMQKSDDSLETSRRSTASFSLAESSPCARSSFTHRPRPSPVTTVACCRSSTRSLLRCQTASSWRLPEQDPAAIT